jgi:hypothetical protein
MKKVLHLGMAIFSANAIIAQVGIGTASPQRNLHVKTAGATTVKIEGDATGYTNADIELVANNSVGGRSLGILMNDVVGNNSWFMGRPYSGSDRFMINRKAAPTFYNESCAITTGGGGLTGTENFLTITSSGNTGVGTTGPMAKLHIKGINPVKTEGLTTAAANEKILTKDSNGIVHQQTAAVLSSQSALNTSLQVSQTVGYPGVTNVAQYDTNTVVLSKGIYLVSPYSNISGMTYSSSYYGQFVCMATAGTIASEFLNIDLSLFASPNGYYNRTPYVLKVKSATATVFTRLHNPTGSTFSTPVGHGFSVYYTKIN